jgi:phosphatidylserine decarboxylase
MKVAREAAPFVLGIVAAAALSGAFLTPWYSLVFLPPLLFTLWFFRDPERTTPSDETQLVSPADGRVIVAGPRRISIFMNVFNVHVCRAPAAGRVRSVVHTPGRFLAAMKDEASDHNERVAILLDGPRGELRFTLVAGLIARRIVCKVAKGRELAAGERVGLIRFGSRVDVDLPDGAECSVRIGDRVVAGETALARYVAAAPSGRVEAPLAESTT